MPDSRAYSKRFALAPSRATRALTVAFALCCAAAVVIVLVPRIGVAAYAMAMAVCAALCGLAAYQAQRRADVLEVGPGDLVAAYRAGQPLCHGTLKGFSQWSGLLLALELRSATGRSWSLSIPADAMDAECFRDLAVRIRQCEREARLVASQEV
jgi:hypothetical protein